MKQYKVFCPAIKKAKIKEVGEIQEFTHGDVVDEQSFFWKYPHIFHEVLGTSTAKVEESEVVPAPQVESVKIPHVKELKTELVITKVSPGWYVVEDTEGNLVHPADGKKLRHKAAQEFIDEN